MPVDPLKIVVAAVPASNGPSLSNEVELVRAAILYADEIELVSPAAEMVNSVVNLAEGDIYGLFSVLAGLPDNVLQFIGNGNSPLPLNWREVLPAALFAIQMGPDRLQRLPGGDQITQAQLDQIAGFNDHFDEIMGTMRRESDLLLQQSGGEELQPAIRAGVVTVSPLFAMGDVNDTATLVFKFMDTLRTLMSDRRVRLLFDDSVAKLVRDMVDAGMVAPHQLTLKHAGEAAVGSGLVSRLPAFTAAPIDELLDLRGDLVAPLSRYRRAVSKMAEKLAYRAFDDESAVEIDDLWRDEVDPALHDLREGLGEHGLVREVAKQMGLDLKTYVSALIGPGLWVGLDTYTSIQGVVSAAVGMAPVAAATGQAAINAHALRREQRAALEKHELFYLYEVERRLGT